VFHKFVVVIGAMALVMIVSGAGASFTPVKLESPEWAESLLKPRPEIPSPLLANDCEKNSAKSGNILSRNICSGEKLSSLTTDNDSNLMKN